MRWNEIKVTVAAKDLETAAAVATVISPGGLHIEDYSDIPAKLRNGGGLDKISGELLKKDVSRSVVRVYLPEKTSLDEAADFIRGRLNNEGVGFELDTKIIDENDWANSWKKYFRPRKIGRVVVCPSWEGYAADGDEIVLTLDPGMSFGTGDHETTQLCLIMLEENIAGGERLLDVGTGSGILGIAALKLGAAFVTAVDIDETAVGIAKENAEINGVTDRFSVFCGNAADERFSKNPDDSFDLISANVIADFHISAAGMFNQKLKTGGKLIVGGILASRADEVKTALGGAGLSVVETKTLNGWAAVAAKKE